MHKTGTFITGGTGVDVSMRLAARPESHSRCRSVAEGDGTRRISVLSITAQDENESMATSLEQKPN